MEIINQKVKEDLKAGKPISLDLGSGGASKRKYYSLDHLPLDGVDIVADMNKPLDLIPNNSVNEIYSRHALEHITEFLPLMCEIHRIVKPNGKIEIIVPHFSNVFGYSDPTHVRLFGLYSMYYFVAPEHQPKSRKLPAFYTDVRFQVESVKIEFYRKSLCDKIVGPLFNFFVNLSFGCQNFYERRLSAFFHAWQIRYVLTPIK